MYIQKNLFFFVNKLSPFIFSLITLLYFFDSPIGYFHDHYYLNYEYEFTKRGLIGHIFYLSDYNFIFIKSLYLLSCLTLVLVICNSNFFNSSRKEISINDLLLKLFFTSTPSITFFYHYTLTLDLYLFVLSLFSIIFLRNFGIIISSLSIFIFGVLGILIHELYASYYFLILIILFMFKFQKFKKINFYVSTIIFFFIVIFFILIFIFGPISIENKIKMLNNNYFIDKNFIELIFYNTISEFKLFFNFNKDQIIDFIINILFFVPSLIILITLFYNFKKTILFNNKIFFLLILLFIFSPICNLIVVPSPDLSRFIFTCINNLIICCIFFSNKTDQNFITLKNNNLFSTMLIIVIPVNIMIGYSNLGNSPEYYYNIIEMRDWIKLPKL